MVVFAGLCFVVVFVVCVCGRVVSAGGVCGVRCGLFVVISQPSMLGFLARSAGALVGGIGEGTPAEPRTAAHVAADAEPPAAAGRKRRRHSAGQEAPKARRRSSQGEKVAAWSKNKGLAAHVTTIDLQSPKVSGTSVVVKDGVMAMLCPRGEGQTGQKASLQSYVSAA